MFFTSYALCNLRLFKLNAEGQTIKTENPTEELQNSIKTLANPGLAQSGFKQPGPRHQISLPT